MTNPIRRFITSGVYHIYNRGVEKRTIFLDKSYYQHFLETLAFYRQEQNQRLSYHLSYHLKGAHLLQSPRKEERRLVTVLAYCLIPNHFHLVLRQLADGGISKFASLILNSYTKYFNTRLERVGPLFQGTFKAKLIETTESFLQVTRYIHLNVLELYPSHLEGERFLRDYPYSSYKIFIGAEEKNPLCQRSEILDLAGNLNSYQTFVESKINGDHRIGIEDLVLEE